MSLISKLRTLFTLGRGVMTGISELTAVEDPIRLFESWFGEAKRAGILLPESMAVATATTEAVPSVRMMLLKAVERDGFVFYTNYGSRKARELDENGRAALVFHWPVLHRQVRVSGTVTRISEEESAAYFRTRDRGSQLGAWASKQSEELEDREALERRYREYEERFRSQEVPLPPFWGGYRLRADSIEFWQGRANRLHDRLLYRRAGDGWEVRRLYP